MECTVREWKKTRAREKKCLMMFFPVTHECFGLGLLCGFIQNITKGDQKNLWTKLSWEKYWQAQFLNQSNIYDEMFMKKRKSIECKFWDFYWIILLFLCLLFDIPLTAPSICSMLGLNIRCKQSCKREGGDCLLIDFGPLINSFFNPLCNRQVFNQISYGLVCARLLKRI